MDGRSTGYSHKEHTNKYGSKKKPTRKRLTMEKLQISLAEEGVVGGTRVLRKKELKTYGNIWLLERSLAARQRRTRTDRTLSLLAERQEVMILQHRWKE